MGKTIIGKKISALCLVMLMLPSMASQAGIQVIGTRVIFNGEKKEASLPVDNNGTRPFLVQAWIDDGKDLGEPPKENTTPFFVTPPLSRLDGGKKNILRVLRVGEMALPTDRESIFWMNVKEIPEVAKEQNVLQIAMRTRIKLFYRPEGLADKFNPQEAYSKLTWDLVKSHSASENEKKIEPGKDKKSFSLLVKNPTPYYITIIGVKINGKEELPSASMVAPFGETVYSLEKTNYAQGGVESLRSRLEINSS
jgi:fimbrial chaperone protein